MDSKEIPVLIIILVMTIIAMMFGLAAWAVLGIAVIFWSPKLISDFVREKLSVSKNKEKKNKSKERDFFLEIAHFILEFSLVFLLCLLGLIANIVIVFPSFVFSWFRKRYRKFRYTGGRLLALTAALLESENDKDRIRLSLKIQRILRRLGSGSNEWRMVKELLSEWVDDVLGLKVFLSGEYLG